MAGADSAVDSYHDEFAQLGGFDDTGDDYMSHPDYAPSFDGAYAPRRFRVGLIPANQRSRHAEPRHVQLLKP